MKRIETCIPDVWIVESETFEDHRGAFARLYCENEFRPILGSKDIKQINRSVTKRVGAVRGLHYQSAPHAETKIIRCLRGRVFDVAVDLRASSPSFLKWTAIELDGHGQSAFVIPEGCAHGFQVLEEDSELLYLHTEFYTPEAEGGVRFDDSLISIEWPLSPTDISTRDQRHPDLTPEFRGIKL